MGKMMDLLGRGALRGYNPPKHILDRRKWILSRIWSVYGIQTPIWVGYQLVLVARGGRRGDFYGRKRKHFLWLLASFEGERYGCDGDDCLMTFLLSLFSSMFEHDRGFDGQCPLGMCHMVVMSELAKAEASIISDDISVKPGGGKRVTRL